MLDEQRKLLIKFYAHQIATRTMLESAVVELAKVSGGPDTLRKIAAQFEMIRAHLTSDETLFLLVGPLLLRPHEERELAKEIRHSANELLNESINGLVAAADDFESRGSD